MLKKKNSAATRHRRATTLRHRNKSRTAAKRSSAPRPTQPESAATVPERMMLKYLFEATQDGNIVLNAQGIIVLANQQAEKMFGYAQSELRGKPAEKLVAEESREKHGQLLKSFLRDPAPLVMEILAQRSDGSHFPVDITLNPVQTQQGLFVLSVVHDISQQREKEREQQIQAELVHLMQDVAVAANEAESVNSVIQYAVNRLCKHLGWHLGHAYLLEEDNALSPSPIWAENAPEKYAVFKAVSEALRFRPGVGLPGMVLESGQPSWVSDLTQHAGFMRMTEAKSAGLQSALIVPVIAGKKVVGVLEFFNEQKVAPDPNLLAVLPHVGVQVGRVIERKRAEEALRKQTMQMRMMMTNLPVILWVMDRDGKLLLLEGKGVNRTGLQPEEMIGKSIFRQFEGRPDILDLIQRTLAGEEIHTEVASSTGGTFETFFMPYYDVNWAVDGIVGLSFDVSERKRMEGELEEMKHRLMESMDMERARLAQQLHDGPLQDLYGAFYQVQEVKSMLNDPGQELTNRVLQTIQGVSATLRVICGELHPNTLVHLGLQRAIRGHAERLQERQEGVTIQLDLADDSPSTGSNLSHSLRLGLYRVYQQLIANAVRHAQAQTIWVRLKLEPGAVVLEVEDNGAGFVVPEHWIELVRAGRYGLVSAIERVQGLEGSLEIHSSPGSGTLVQVQVPVH